MAMASHLARRVRGSLSRSLPSRLGLAPQLQQRSIHLTPIVHKKKSKVAYDDDLFSEDAFVEEDLIKDTSSHSTKAKVTVDREPAPSASTSTSASAPGFRLKKSKLTPAARLARFESQITYIEPRLVRNNPAVPNPRIKRRSLFTLVQLASSEAELSRVAELLPKYKEAGVEVLPHFAEAFVRRCQELNCPPLALQIFGNFAKYNLPLTLPAAHQLIHSLYVLYPLDKLMVATALFPIYNLPPISADLTTASMVVAACYKHGTTASLELAQGLRLHVIKMLRKAVLAREDTDGLEERKKKKWVAWSLHKVNKAAERRDGRPFVTPGLIPGGYGFPVMVRNELPGISFP